MHPPCGVDCFHRGLRIVPVSQHDQISAGAQLPDLTARDDIACSSVDDLAFNARVNGSDGGDAPSLRVAPAPAGAPAPAPILVARAPHRAPRHSARRPVRNRTARAPRRHRGLPASPSPAPAHGAGEALPATPAPADRVPEPSGGAPSSPAPDGGPLAPAAQAARDTSASAAGAVAPAVPPAAGPVETAGGAVAGAVEQADHAAAATLGTVGR